MVNYRFFLKRIPRPFLKFYMKLENLKGQKIDRANLILFLERKNLALGKMPKISPKTGFFDFCQKINPFMFLFYPNMVRKRVLCDSPKSTGLQNNLVLKCSISLSSISLERIKWYLSYFSWSWSSSQGSI